MYRRLLAVLFLAILLTATGGLSVVAADTPLSGQQAIAQTSGSSPLQLHASGGESTDPEWFPSTNNQEPPANETDQGEMNESVEEDPPDEEVENDSLADEPIGQVNGIFYDDSIDVNQSDGLTDEELHDYVSRSMARVEYIRDLKFQSMVSVEVISRDEYRSRIEAEDDNSTYDDDFVRWNNVVWQSIFVVDQHTDVNDDFDAVRGEAVSGFYDTRTGNVTIVSGGDEDLTIDNATLIHELTHALQDQHFNLSDERFTGKTQDEQLAILGLIEGDADYVMLRYIEYCETEWECVETPPTTSDESPDPGEFNFGVWALLYQPYSDGPAYVHDLVEADGWTAVNQLYADPPSTSREIIHREPFVIDPIEVEDTSSPAWRPYAEYGVDGTDRLGEASIFVMFWYQSLEFNAGVFDPISVFTTELHPYSEHNYRSTPSTGWTNDILVPYRSTSGNDDAYVWVTRWETDRDAESFRNAYVDMLTTTGAHRTDHVTWEVASRGFEGHYRIVLDDDTVTVVHAPTAAGVSSIKPELDRFAEPPRLQIDPLDPSGAFPSSNADDDATEVSPEPADTSTAIVGFVILVAGFITMIVAVLGAFRLWHQS